MWDFDPSVTHLKPGYGSIFGLTFTHRSNFSAAKSHIGNTMGYFRNWQVSCA
jgi:hypothetical protein